MGTNNIMKNKKYYRVSKVKNPKRKTGFHYKYSIKKNGKEIEIRRESLDDLKEDVLKLGLPWGLQENRSNLNITQERFDEAYILNNKIKYSRRLHGENQIGIMRVRKKKRYYNNKIYYQYRIRRNGKEYTISSPDLEILKEKVIEQGLPWEKTK